MRETRSLSRKLTVSLGFKEDLGETEVLGLGGTEMVCLRCCILFSLHNMYYRTQFKRKIFEHFSS